MTVNNLIKAIHEGKIDISTFFKSHVVPIRSNKPLTYAPGDLVKHRHSGMDHVILEAVLKANGITEYLTNMGSRYKHVELIFVAKASPESLKLATVFARGEK